MSFSVRYWSSVLAYIIAFIVLAGALAFGSVPCKPGWWKVDTCRMTTQGLCCVAHGNDWGMLGIHSGEFSNNRVDLSIWDRFQ